MLDILSDVDVQSLFPDGRTFASALNCFVENEEKISLLKANYSDGNKVINTAREIKTLTYKDMWCRTLAMFTVGFFVAAFLMYQYYQFCTNSG